MGKTQTQSNSSTALAVQKMQRMAYIAIIKDENIIMRCSTSKKLGLKWQLPGVKLDPSDNAVEKLIAKFSEFGLLISTKDLKPISAKNYGDNDPNHRAVQNCEVYMVNITNMTLKNRDGYNFYQHNLIEVKNKTHIGKLLIAPISQKIIKNL